MELVHLLKRIENSPRFIVFIETLKCDLKQIDLTVDRKEYGRRIRLYLFSVFHALKSSLEPMNSTDLLMDNTRPPITMNP
jgi:hypothetical protein